MVDCGGFGNIDFFVKVIGLVDVGFCLIIVLFLGNFYFIVIFGVDFYMFF